MSRVTLNRDWSGSYYDVLLDGEPVVERLLYTQARETAQTVKIMLRVAEIVKASPAPLLKTATGRKFR